jgi:3-oxoacyl-[acyl-carrier protein] reductase
MVAAPGSHELDVRDDAAVRRYFAKQPANLLICAAGITRDAPLARLSEFSWIETWDVNFKGVLRCVEAALPRMIERRAGHVILISSFSALHPPIGQNAYATSKAALLGLVTDLAVRHGPSNIRVNAVLPGFLETRMTETVTECRKSEVLDSHVLGRFNTCAAVADFIRFLHHGLPHTSGQVFQLDSRISGNFP